MTAIFTVSLETVFDAIPVGLGIVDADRRIVLMNQAFRDSIGLPDDAFPPGTPVEDAVRASALRGIYGPGDPDAQVKAIMALDRSRPGRLRRRTFAGRSYDLYNTPFPDGGYVISAIETTALLAAQAEAETALARTTSALTTSRIGLAVFDPNHALLFANPRFAALLALPPDRLIAGFDFDSVLALMERREEYGSPDGLMFLDSLRKVAFSTASTLRRQRADGRSIDIMFDPLPDGGCTIAVSDITPQAQAEDEARRRARLLDLVLLNVPHGICVYGADHRVAMFNDTYIKVMEGAPLRVGDSLSDVIRRRAASGEYGEGEPETIIAAQMAYNITRPQARRRVRPNGTAIDVRTAPLPDGGHISVVTDITALVQAEAEIRRRAEDMSIMLDNIRHGIMLWGPDKRLVASNPVAARLLDLPDDVLVPGRAEGDVIADLSASHHFGPTNEMAPMARMLNQLDRSVPFGREFVSRTGRILYAQSNPAPGGGWITTLSDITRMRETETELRRAKDLAEAANLAKSRFLATMSHELRTPLNAIIGFSEALTLDGGDVRADLVADYSNQINESGRQLLALINIILDVARIESGGLEPGGEVVDVEKAIRAAVRQVDSAALTSGISIQVVVPDDLPSIQADERRLVQALVQILSNAVKFSAPGGSVVVGSQVNAAGDLCIGITDTGIGIPAHELERVFEPFTQIDSALSRQYPGAGLGLFLARAIVTAHDGNLRLTSEVGRGTTVSIELPRSRILPDRGR